MREKLTNIWKLTESIALILHGPAIALYQRAPKARVLFFTIPGIRLDTPNYRSKGHKQALDGVRWVI